MKRKLLSLAVAGALASSAFFARATSVASAKSLEPLRDRQPKPKPVEHPKHMAVSRGQEIRRFIPRRNG